MTSTRSQLPPPDDSQRRPSLIGEDYRFDPTRLAPAVGFRVDHESVHLLERPLALDRTYRLRDAGDIQLDMTLRLCWRGGADPIESLLAFVESFQRPVPIEQVRRVSDEGLGEYGLAWAWDDPLGAEVVGFVRANVVVTIQAPDGAGLAERVARAIDGDLARLRTVDGYPEPDEGALDRVREAAGRERPAVAPGGRLALGRQPPGERWFFLTTSGSANREPSAPDAWYYRAGLVPGPVELRLFRADTGLVPVVERLALDVG